MNVDSLKSELQQVLDNDVILRKEFNELKRSLSDYRNQLIMRDEDCKRLQVTIDVLNTKLLVMERDNTSYKSELTSFKDLRDSINEQLESKQVEIDARLEEIQTLRQELNGISAEYEARIEAIQQSSEQELEQVKAAHALELQELKSNTHYKEAGIREEFENNISELHVHWADKEQSLLFLHEDELQNLREQQQSLVESMRQEYATALSQLSLASSLEVQTLQQQHQEQITQLEHSWAEKLSQIESTYQNEIEGLRSSQEAILNETQSQHETRIAELILEHEEKLSNILIHSNSQNSKLNEELSKSVSEAGESKENLLTIQSDLEAKTIAITELNQQLNQLKNELVNEVERYAVLNSDFEIFKQNASVSDNEKINDLNSQIIDLNAEISNMSYQFETATNEMAESEKLIELKSRELESLQQKLNASNLNLIELQSNISSREEEMEVFKAEFQVSIQDEIHNREVEFEKLLAENTNLIAEIEQVFTKLEAKELELTVLQNEMEQLRLQGLAKTEDFKDTLALKQTEIINLENSVAELLAENQQLKEQNELLNSQVLSVSDNSVELLSLKENNETLISEKLNLTQDLEALKLNIVQMETDLRLTNEKTLAYEKEISELKNAGSVEEQEAFIDRLFKQIDGLNDQKLSLLDEKEQMANQLLKMNDVISSLSQQVDNENIDVTSLNNHRKSVILANNSPEKSEKSQMKEEINNLVREIDKCIALLSA